MNIFTSSDHHMGHRNIIEYCNRKFSSVDEMDDFYVKQWNDTVKPEDIIYYLGDLSFHPETYLDRLNGKIHYILGNHDFKKANQIRRFKNVISVEKLDVIKIDNIDITLCHYKMYYWFKSHFNSWHFYGHSHQRASEWGKSLDVGIDAGHIFEWAEIKEIMKNKPDNPNLVRNYVDTQNSNGKCESEPSLH
jgi:calcineurin-like phosphoesterase family protein